MEIYGKHTAAAEKNLSLSPYQINFGNRIPVIFAAKKLGLTNVRRHDVKKNGEYIGRTVLVEGDYKYCVKDRMGESHRGKIRIALAETQMSFGATEINQREYAECAEKVEIAQKPGLFQIRVGSALAINQDEPRIRIGDIVIPNNNVFFGGAVLQSCGYTPPIDLSKITDEMRQESRKFLEQWNMLGGRITKDGRYLVNKNNRTLIDAIAAEARETGATYYLGSGCYSKDSLYGERNLLKMVEFGRQYRVITSEMEQGMNAYVADDALHRDRIKIMTGAVIAQIGMCWKDGNALGAGSKGYAETRKEKHDFAVALENSFKIAANTLAKMKEALGNQLLF